MQEAYLQICDLLAAAARFAVKVLMAAITVDVLLGVFFRYVLRDALSWTEELARYLMIWMGFLGAGLALREGGHVALDILLVRMPLDIRRIMIVAVRLLSLLFLLSVVGAGLVLIPGVRSYSTPALGISMMWAYLAIPVGCFFTAIQMLALMLRNEGKPEHPGTQGPAGESC